MRFQNANRQMKSGEDVFDRLQMVKIQNGAPVRQRSCLC